MKKKQKELANDVEDVSSVYIINESDKGFEHEYDVKYNYNKGKTIITRSNSSEWSEDCRGEIVGSLIDNGNDVHIHIDGESIALDYSQMEILTSLIIATNKFEIEIREQKLIAKLTSKNDI